MTQTHRPKSEIEELGERCLSVVKAHARDKAPTLELICAFACALGVRISIELSNAPQKEDAK